MLHEVLLYILKVRESYCTWFSWKRIFFFFFGLKVWNSECLSSELWCWSWVITWAAFVLHFKIQALPWQGRYSLFQLTINAEANGISYFWKMKNFWVWSFHPPTESWSIFNGNLQFWKVKSYFISFKWKCLHASCCWKCIKLTKKEKIDADLSSFFPCGFCALNVLLDKALYVVIHFCSWLFLPLVKWWKITNSFLFKGRRGEKLPHLLPALCLCSIARV